MSDISKKHSSRFQNVKKTLHIVVADRNRHVRDFLKRELEAEHHKVQTTCNLVDTVRMIHQEPRPDLLILDSYLTEPDAPVSINRLLKNLNSLPVVLHTYDIHFDFGEMHRFNIITIEKKGNSIEKIKQVVRYIESSLASSEPVEDGMMHQAQSKTL